MCLFKIRHANLTFKSFILTKLKAWSLKFQNDLDFAFLPTKILVHWNLLWRTQIPRFQDPTFVIHLTNWISWTNCCLLHWDNYSKCRNCKFTYWNSIYAVGSKACRLQCWFSIQLCENGQITSLHFLICEVKLSFISTS